MVGRWPGSPLELDLVTSSNGGADGGVGGVQVADDVWAGVVGAGNESVGQILGVRPSNDRWGRAVVLHRGAVSLVVGTTDNETLNISVGGDG